MEKPTKPSLIDWPPFCDLVAARMKAAIKAKKTLVIHISIKDGRMTVDYDGVAEYK